MLRLFKFLSEIEKLGTIRYARLPAVDLDGLVHQVDSAPHRNRCSGGTSFFFFFAPLCREARPMLLVANLLKTLGMAGYFFFNNLSWAMKFNIVSGTHTRHTHDTHDTTLAFSAHAHHTPGVDCRPPTTHRGLLWLGLCR